jgi:hypothetical protein
MKQQDLKALAGKAVDRAVAARETAGAELTEEQVASVSGGGAAGLSYIKDPTWYGIWEILKTVKTPGLVEVGVVAQPIAIDANQRLDAAAKVGF